MDVIQELITGLAISDDDAYHSLLELPDEFVPELTDLFRIQPDNRVKGHLVHIIWQHRLPSTIPFLASLLADPVDEVWKQALDGLVAIGGHEARDALQSFQCRLPSNSDRLAWIDEAIEQLD